MSHPGPGPFGAAAAAGRYPARPGPAATRHAAGSADAVAGALPWTVVGNGPKNVWMALWEWLLDVFMDKKRSGKLM